AFVTTAASLSLPTDTPLKNNADFRYIGKELPRVDAMAKSTGTAPYGIDTHIDGMHYAVVRRSPVAGAKLKSVDKTAASKLAGVTDIIEISNGVAVVAEKYWQAKTAADALSTEWESVPLSTVSTKQVESDYKHAMENDEGVSAQKEGDFEKTLAESKDILESEFWAPYLAHAPLEPMNAVLKIENGEADIWTGSQGPVGVQGLVSKFTGIEQDRVRVHNLYLGGGFGRRATLTHIIEVTEIAVATSKTIKLTWSREDDIKHGLYRPASLMKIKAGVDDNGYVTAWQAKRAGGNITPETLRNMFPAFLPGLGDGTLDFLTGLAEDVFTGMIPDPSSIEGLAEGYDLPNREVQHFSVEHGLPLTFWRSVGHSHNAFAKEAMMDELAEIAGMDPVEFRLKNTENNPRLHNVIKVAGEKMKTMSPPEGHYLGFAAHGCFATDVAEIAEVSVEHGRIKVHKVTCVVDCGIAVTPDIVRAQMEGGIMFALTAALHGRLDLENGEIVQSNFHDYQILRMDESPEVEVVIIESEDDPTGVGEPGVPPLAPAVASALYAATGQRLRSLPLKLA
ncbi:MAG: xanthine dehydrogenase family protein molybdopterin-binding subunit, partial [Gammaproteobacteria bacterium]|nr:xanthine dehydrogenase family protein molybdopterin-binding subunit [Gammaproteobacteria bacterium]